MFFLVVLSKSYAATSKSATLSTGKRVKLYCKSKIAESSNSTERVEQIRNCPFLERKQDLLAFQSGVNEAETVLSGLFFPSPEAEGEASEHTKVAF